MEKLTPIFHSSMIVKGKTNPSEEKYPKDKLLEKWIVSSLVFLDPQTTIFKVDGVGETPTHFRKDLVVHHPIDGH